MGGEALVLICLKVYKDILNTQKRLFVLRWCIYKGLYRKLVMIMLMMTDVMCSPKNLKKTKKNRSKKTKQKLVPGV